MCVANRSGSSWKERAFTQEDCVMKRQFALKNEIRQYESSRKISIFYGSPFWADDIVGGENEHCENIGVYWDRGEDALFLGGGKLK